jgi:hypothetical protein
MPEPIYRTIDRGHETERLYSPVCTFCRHLREPRRCDAFPDRIPDAIWEGQHDHREPFPGDRGIRFEAAEGAETEGSKP